MPASDEILQGLTAIANGWTSLAIAWHIVVGALIVALLAGWRPLQRFAGLFLVLPLATVSIAAWSAGNPFNGGVFAALSIALMALALSLPGRAVVVDTGWSGIIGIAMIVFGWIYPHFLVADSPFLYLIAAPLGLIPCPTLSAVIGFALVFGGFGARAWSMTLAVVGVFYALFGAVRLQVTIDLILLAGAVCLLIVAFRSGARRASIGKVG